MTRNVPASSIIRSLDDGAFRRFSPGSVLRRLTGWIRDWHGGQLLTFCAGAAVIPWQVRVWRQILISYRFEAFLDPGRAHGWGDRIAEILVYFVIPLLAILVTAVWVSGRIRRAPSRRG